MVVICLGPVCIPLWPVLALTLKPIWDRLVPEAAKEWLIAFWIKLRDTVCPRRSTPAKTKPLTAPKAVGAGRIVKIESEEQYKAAVVASKKRPAVIKFTADFCNPCKLVAPRVLDLAHELEGKADFYEIDIEQLEDLAIELGVSSIPAFHVIASGTKQAEVVGTNIEKLRESIRSNLDSSRHPRESSKTK